MTSTALRDDALSTTADGFSLRLGLPWIRSLPLAGLEKLSVSIDGAPVSALTIELADRRVSVETLATERAWWFLQDRVLVCGDIPLQPGGHDVSVSFRLIVPYLQVTPSGPLILTFQVDRSLVLDAPAPAPTISRSVA